MELVVNTAGTFIGKTSERIVVRTKQDAQEFPVDEIESLLITSNGVTISSDAVALLMEREKAVVFVSRGGEIYARISGRNEMHASQVRLLQMQALENGRGLSLAQEIIATKLKNQAATLKYFAKSRTSDPAAHELLYARAAEVLAAAAVVAGLRGSLADLRDQIFAAEGGSGRSYWAGIAAVVPPELQFTRRERRGATDPVNVALNYGYGILSTKVLAAVLRGGLDPYVGFLHSLKDGRPSLVYDLMEEFRSVTVDRPVLGWLTRGGKVQWEEPGTLDKCTRAKLAELVLGRLGSPLPFDGRDERIERIIQSKAFAVARHLKGEEPYQGFVGSW